MTVYLLCCNTAYFRYKNSTMKMEALCASETSVSTYQTARCRELEEYNMNFHLIGHLKYRHDLILSLRAV
jgi:hypothetical protein